MDLLSVGNTVTIKVKNLMWPYRSRYAQGVVATEYNTYHGTVVHQRWFENDEIGITTGDKQFPFRRIKKSSIVEVNNNSVDYVKPLEPKTISITVKGSKGDTYIVTKENGRINCTCPGFQFRRACKHSQEMLV
jgi:hypothetical protein